MRRAPWLKKEYEQRPWRGAELGPFEEAKGDHCGGSSRESGVGEAGGGNVGMR